MDRNRKARWRYIVHHHVRAGRIGPKGAWALEILPDYLARDGRCDPSHARLAADAGVGERTVERALADAKALGLLDWDRRIVRTGWRAEQTSNAYVLIVPGKQECANAHPALRICAPIKSIKLESGFSAAVAVAALPVMDPAAQQARIAAKWAEERRLRQAQLAVRIGG
jgi:hypothetical protein